MGHIFFISPSSPGSLDRMSQWTLRWLLENDMAEDCTMYTCNSVEEATGILETARNRGLSKSSPTPCPSRRATTAASTGFAGRSTRTNGARRSSKCSARLRPRSGQKTSRLRDSSRSRVPSSEFLVTSISDYKKLLDTRNSRN